MGAVLGVVVVMALVVAHLGAAAADRAAARTAADAAALAAALATVDPVGGIGGDPPVARSSVRAAADEAARRNGAELESVDVLDGRVEVSVRVGRSGASAAATAERR